MMESNEIREKFYKILQTTLGNKREDNKALLSAAEYDAKIRDLKQAKIVLLTPSSKKSTKHYRMVRKYDILTIKGKERLIKPIDDSSKVLYYVTNEELFDIIHSTHTEISHGGRNRMVAELKEKYCNITKEAIMIYLKLCAHCQKKSGARKSLVSKPILQSVCSSRAQIDMIDMQSQNYDNYHFILVYQDHQTKFVLLKALKSKCADEVACHLLEMYTAFGAPVFLDSDLGCEFINSVITELHAKWSDVKIVPGKSRQSLGEHANKDIEEMLGTWMVENKCADWPTGLKFIQFQKNRALNSEIRTSPYEAMFGCPARLGLVSTVVPYDEIQQLNSEDVEELLQQMQKQQTEASELTEAENQTPADQSIKIEFPIKIETQDFFS